MEFIIGSNPAPAAGPAGDIIKDGSSATFMTDVVEMSKQVPVIAYFTAAWCGPCKQLGPMLEKVVREARGAVRMVKIDVDKNQDVAAQLRVQSVPTIYALKGGRPIDAFTGAQPESQLRAFVKRLTQGDGGPSLDDVIAEAKQLLAEGDAETAGQAFQQILAEDPSNAPALAGLMRCLMALGDVENVKQMLAQLPADMSKHADIAAMRTAVELHENAAAGAGQSAELRRRLANDPADHQARFDLAMAYYGGGEVEAAIDELLDLFRRDRMWNEDGARKQLLKLFEALGPAHPAVSAGRRRLSTLLFS